MKCTSLVILKKIILSMKKLSKDIAITRIGKGSPVEKRHKTKLTKDPFATSITIDKKMNNVSGSLKNEI